MESSLFSFWSQLTGGIVFKFLRVKVKSSGSAEKGVTRVDPVADMFKVTDICRCNFCPVKANWLESQRISTLQGGCISWGCCEPKMSTFQKCPNCLAAMRESADGGRCPPESRDPPAVSFRAPRGRLISSQISQNWRHMQMTVLMRCKRCRWWTYLTNC